MRLDVTDPVAVQETLRGQTSVMSAIPYYYNGPMARAAVEAGCHFSDLGGNTEIVFEQKKLHDQAVAPGRLGHPRLRTRAGHGQHPRRRGHPAARSGGQVKIYVGGLPQQPEPPLNYQIVYSLEGALDYYTTPSWVLARRQAGRRWTR